MSSQANDKNMSSMDCSYEQQSGSDSENSFSEDFNDIGGRNAEKIKMVEVHKKKNRKKKNKTSSDVEVCKWVFVKGNSNGKMCGKNCSDGREFCSKHSRCGPNSKEKIENSNQYDSESAGMASQENTKNMSTVLSTLTSTLLEILKSTCKDKVVFKVMKALQTEEAQEKIASSLEKHIATKTSTKRSFKKTNKDPNAPKKNISSYIFFCKAQRSNVKDNNPDMDTKDITRELGRLWKQLDDDKKKEYIDQATKDKERYESDMKDYTPSPDIQVSESENKKTKKKKTGPKKSLSAYIFFCLDMRDKIKKENDDMTTKEVTSELGRIWKEEYKNDEKKAEKYNKLAAEDKERYNTEKENWSHEESDKSESDKEDSKKSESESDKEEYVSENTVDTKSKKTKKTKKIKTPFMRFCLENRKKIKTKNPKWKPKQITEELANNWNSMEEDEKQAYDSDE